MGINPLQGCIGPKFNMIGGKTMPVMTPEEFAKRMEAWKSLAQGDPETAHSEADELMVKILSLLGYHEGCQSFITMRKWYA